MKNNLVIGSNPQMRWIIDTIGKVAPYDATVLLTGESGVGKNRFASMIHDLSGRKKARMVSINCGAIPENLLESELFGYEKGAFTGADVKGKPGLLEMAEKGTLFLDEIGDLPMQMQVKLLKALQEKKIKRVGGVQEKIIDFRLIAATNKDLKTMVESGEFRKDLFYRLNVISLDIPPIRKRKEDIPEFVEVFTTRYNEKYGKNVMFSGEALERMKKHSWPGNIRELENVVEGIVLTIDGTIVAEDMLPPGVCTESAIKKYGKHGKTLRQMLEEVEQKILAEAYEQCGTTTKVAEMLGVSQATVSLKLKKYSIKKR